MSSDLMKAYPLPYTMYYKPIGYLPYISSEQGGGLIMLIYELPKLPTCTCIQELGVGL